MKNVILKGIVIGLFLKFLNGQTVVVGSGVTTTTVIGSTGDGSVTAIAHPGNAHLNLAGAVWVCDSSLLNPSGGYVMTFQAIFTADCTLTQGTVKFSGDNSIDMYLNGQLIGSGTAWNVAYSATADLLCGQNNLTAVTTNAPGGPSLQGAVFQVTQDQSSCYICDDYNKFPSNALKFVNQSDYHWSQANCGCMCKGTATCLEPLSWFDYPVCGCACPKNYSCLEGQFNHSTCQC